MPLTNEEHYGMLKIPHGNLDLEGVSIDLPFNKSYESSNKEGLPSGLPSDGISCLNKLSDNLKNNVVESYDIPSVKSKQDRSSLQFHVSEEMDEILKLCLPLL